MTSEQQSDPLPDPSGDPDSRTGNSAGWLTAIKSALGLAESPTLRETIEQALRSEQGADSDFRVEEREMLLRLLRFGQSRVEDIMVPRADIIAIDESATVAELLATFQEAGVSRIPVFSDTLDDPRGMVHIKDLFVWMMSNAAERKARNGNGVNGVPAQAGAAQASRGTAPAAIKTGDAGPAAPPSAAFDLTCIDLGRSIAMTRIRRDVLYVPPSMPTMNLLIRMQSTRIHMALVVDEYGGTDGLVTIEDLIEQIVGDIEDEHDEAEASQISEDPKAGLLASARAPVEELEKRVGHKLLTPDEEEEIDTLGGLVFSIVERVPARGELVRHHSGIEFEVLDADARRIKRLKIHLPPAENSVQTATHSHSSVDRSGHSGSATG